MKASCRYREFDIYHRPKPVPTRIWDWDYVHKDYDGPGDPRCGQASSVEEAKRDIDELLGDLEEEAK